MKKIMLLGINGFSGQHFQQYVRENSLLNIFEFIGVDKVIHPKGSFKCNEIDLLNPSSLSSLITKESPDYIVNLVGTFQNTDFDTFLAINAGITQKLLDLIAKNNIPIKKILLVGSAAEYGIPLKLPIQEDAQLRPVNWYGLCKMVQTEYANYYFQNYKIPIIIARTFNIIGKGISPALSIGGFIERIMKAKNKDTIEVGNIDTKRDFLDIKDVVDAYWKLLIEGKSGEAYNVCRGESTYIKDILTHLIKQSHKSLEVKLNKALMKTTDVPDIYGDNSKLRKDTKWEPKVGVFDSLTNSL